MTQDFKIASIDKIINFVFTELLTAEQLDTVLDGKTLREWYKIREAHR